MTSYHISDPQFEIAVRLVPWDSHVLGVRGAQIDHLLLTKPVVPASPSIAFQRWVTSEGIGFVSCRIASDRVAEGFVLEAQGFRFIEMVLHPARTIDPSDFQADPELMVRAARPSDVPRLVHIAQTTFHHERFHSDPSIDRSAADLRYANWVRHVAETGSPSLLAIELGGTIIGVFVVDLTESGVAHWQLTAIAPEFQGVGLGRRTWQAMLRHHAMDGIRRVQSTITVRNLRVLNLYSSLGFRFEVAEMTYHWHERCQPTVTSS